MAIIKITQERFLTAADYGRKLKPQITTRRVTALCFQGRVAGAIRLARSWLIPANAKDPRKLNKCR
jgi:hypothetical protein